MKATGIVRRIDDLGRVVIPKEIRRTMRIKEGAPLEIFTNNDGEVIFKKYSPVGELSESADIYTEILNKQIKNTVFLTDNEYVISASGQYKKDLFERRISRGVEELIEKRKLYTYKIGDSRINAVDSSEKHHIGILSPIIVSGDTIGAVGVLTGDMGNVPSESDAKLVQTISGLIAKQMEI